MRGGAFSDATAVLVIGAGGSGLRAAIELAERGTDVLVVSKRSGSDAHTSLAAGGINAALATVDPGTGVEGLYAVGEAASGLHGANRLGGNSLIELLVYGRIVGEAAAVYSAGLAAQQRSARALAEARAEIDELLAADGPENVRALQRAVRDVMTAHAGVVRDEPGIMRGLAERDAIEDRVAHVGVHPDLAGFQDLAHAFDLQAAVLAGRATLEVAMQRRETRGCPTAPTTPPSTSRSRSTSSGRGPAGSSGRRFHRSPRTSPR